MNDVGGERFRGLSAGSAPSGRVNPEALAMLTARGYDTHHVRSKSWDEFADANAPPVHFIFTVCDEAAEEVCPVWPGKPMSAHWGVADPSRFVGTDEARHAAFQQTHDILRQRILEFTTLPFEALNEMTLQHKLTALGQS